MHKHKLKTVFVGDCTVGKTTLIEQIRHDRYNNSIQSTIGVTYSNIKYTMADGTNVELDMWDTAGQERFASLIPMYYKNAAVCIFVFDLRDRETYLDIGRRWYSELINRTNNDKKVVCYMLGNKLDLVEDGIKRRVTKEEGKIMAESMNMAGYYEVSAKTGEGIYEFREELSKMVRKLDIEMEKEEKTIMKLENPQIKSMYDIISDMIPKSRSMCMIL